MQVNANHIKWNEVKNCWDVHRSDGCLVARFPSKEDAEEALDRLDNSQPSPKIAEVTL